jgi:hypothetical protein
LPGATIVRVANAESSATLRYAWSRRLETELRPSYAIAGGIDTAAQRALPQTRTARVDLSFDYRATRRDGLDTELGVARIWTSNGFDHVLSTALERWSRSFTPESGGTLGAGVAVSQTTGPMDEVTDDLGPIGSASLWQTARIERVELQLDLSTGYSPHVNVLSGTLQDRLFATARVTGTTGEASVSLSLSGTQTYPRDALDAAESISADLAIERALLDWLIAELGGQIVWQRIGPSDVAMGGSRAMVYAGLRGQAPHVRF